MNSTKDKQYTQRLQTKGEATWKKLLNVQLPYKLNVRILVKGKVLEVGCGIGRNLNHIKENCVGVDHNESSIEFCKDNGFQAYVEEDFWNSDYSKENTFDSLLLSHLLEHLTIDDSIQLIKKYMKVLKPDAQIIIFTPQEAGFKSDETHVTFCDFEIIKTILDKCGFQIEKQYSFPFPRIIGKIFTYNEFVVVGKQIGYNESK